MSLERDQAIPLPGITKELLKPWGDHEPDPAAFAIYVQYQDGRLTPEQLQALEHVTLPEAFTIRFEFSDADLGTLGLSAVMDASGQSPATADIAMDMGFFQLLKSQRESASYYLAMERAEAGIELSFDEAANINRTVEEQVVFHPLTATIECYPASWNFPIQD